MNTQDQVPVIALNNVSIRYGDKCAISDLSATFLPGTITALIGGDGAGKTSLLAALANPHQRNRLGVIGLSARDVGYQGMSGGVWRGLSVEENLAFIARAYHLDPNDSAQRMTDLIAQAGLETAKSRLGSTLSGGMRQKLGAIMAMLPNPRLLLLDEPTTGVDQDSRATLWALMRSAVREGAAVVLSTTYIDEAEQADQVIVLSEGITLAQGSPEEVIGATPGVVYESYADIGDAISDAADVWRRGHRVYTWYPYGQSQGTPFTGAELETEPSQGQTLASLDLEIASIALALAKGQTAKTELPAITTSYPMQEPLIHVQQVSKTFGDVVALDGVDLEVLSGHITGLIGGNGAGKSTLIRLILGLDQPNSGRITLFGQPPGRVTRAQIGYVPQSLGLYPTLSPEENYQFIAAIYKSEAPDLGLEANTLTGRLPLGYQRNLAVTCAFSHQPRLLILDEPTSGMDPLSRARLWKALRHGANCGIGILITTHYQDEARQCDQLIQLEHGRVRDTLHTDNPRIN